MVMEIVQSVNLHKSSGDGGITIRSIGGTQSLFSHVWTYHKAAIHFS